MFFSYKPKRILFELTNRCNLKCKMCDIWKEQPKKDFDLELLKNIIKEKSLKKIKYIGLTGGEPFLIKNFEDYYQIIKKYKPKAFININTNGFFTGKIEKFLKFKNTKKLSLTISYDGIKKHDIVRGKKESAKKVLNTIKMIKEKFLELKTTVKFTITPWNCFELLDVANSAMNMETELQIKMIEELKSYTNRIYDLGEKKKFDKPASNSINQQLEEILKLDIKTNRKYIKELIKKNYQNHKTCNWPVNMIVIGLNGDVFLCRKKSPIGNINHENISDIIKSKRKDIIKNQINKCNDFDCISHTYK